MSGFIDVISEIRRLEREAGHLQASLEREQDRRRKLQAQLQFLKANCILQRRDLPMITSGAVTGDNWEVRTPLKQGELAVTLDGQVFGVPLKDAMDIASALIALARFFGCESDGK